MKGLLLKDFKLIKEQKMFFIIIAFITIGMVFVNYDFSFIIGYPSFIFSLFVLSTISYDELDNGYTFLFTLPISKKSYVLEKYIFGILTGGLCWVVTTILTTLYQAVTLHGFNILEWLSAAAIILSVLFIMLAVMIPFQLKFGSEKVRIMMFITFGIIFVISFLIQKVISILNIDIIALIHPILISNTSIVVGIAIIISILLLLLSYRLSIKIMIHREF